MARLRYSPGNDVVLHGQRLIFECTIRDRRYLGRDGCELTLWSVSRETPANTELLTVTYGHQRHRKILSEYGIQ